MTQGATSRRKASGRGQQPSAKKRKYKPTWTRVFVCLASTGDDRMPSPSYYRELKKASLGERNITFNLSDNSVEFDFKLKMEFPKLEMAGGYVLMCSHSTSRVLEELKPPYNVQRLKRETGQCKIFIRPLQSDLDLTPDACEEEKEVKLLLTQCPFLPLLTIHLIGPFNELQCDRGIILLLCCVSQNSNQHLCCFFDPDRKKTPLSSALFVRNISILQNCLVI